VAVRYFGITEQGNFTDHSHPQPLAGQNVLSIVAPKLAEADQGLLRSAKKKMLEVRAKRVRPHLDDKILASWNGLMLGAFARASAVLGDEKYRTAAEKNVKFVRSKLWQDNESTLFHRWRDGERDKVELLEGYAFMLGGVVELYEATLEPRHLDFAINLAGAMPSRNSLTRKTADSGKPRGEGSYPAREGRLRWRGAVGKFRRDDGVAEIRVDDRSQEIYRSCGENLDPVRGSHAADAPGIAVYDGGAGFFNAGTATRGRGRRC